MFEICQFLYQTGVLISRGSLEFLKLKVTGWVTIGQAIICSVFLMFCLAWKDVSIWLVFPLTFGCGILGGWGYLWSMY